MRARKIFSGNSIPFHSNDINHADTKLSGENEKGHTEENNRPPSKGPFYSLLVLPILVGEGYDAR